MLVYILRRLSQTGLVLLLTSMLVFAGLFLIGDPKQAIYAFRGADIYTYLRARQATLVAHYYVEGDLQDLALATGGCVADSAFGRKRLMHSQKIPDSSRAMVSMSR